MNDVAGSCCGLLLVGHGTRDASGLAEFVQLATSVEILLPECIVQMAFLELATPDIATGIDRLIKRDVRRIVVAPVLLFSAGHAKRDIPSAVKQALAGVPDVQLSFSQTLDCHSKLIELSERRFLEATRLAAGKAVRFTLLMVGRGSSDEEATAAMGRYAEFLANRLNVDHYDVAFMAMAQPSFANRLRFHAECSFAPIVVQPHLLFQGDVLRDLQQEAARVAREENATVLVARHLGPDPLVAQAIAELAQQARRF